MSDEFTQGVDEELRVEAKESIKIIKNSKGYNWEIKVVHKEDIETQMNRLDRINERMETKYGKVI